MTNLGQPHTVELEVAMMVSKIVTDLVSETRGSIGETLGARFSQVSYPSVYTGFIPSHRVPFADQVSTGL